MSKNKSKEIVRHIAIDPDHIGKLKAIGGADQDDWNEWLASRIARSMPIDQTDKAAAIKATVAV